MATGININLRAVRARLRVRTGPAGTQEVLAGGGRGAEVVGGVWWGGTQEAPRAQEAPNFALKTGQVRVSPERVSILRSWPGLP